MCDELKNIRQCNNSNVIPLEEKIHNLDGQLCQLKLKSQVCKSTDCCGTSLTGGGKSVRGE